MGIGSGVSNHESRSHATSTEGGINDDGGWGRMAWLEGRGFILGRMGVVTVMVEEEPRFWRLLSRYQLLFDPNQKTASSNPTSG